MRAYVNLFGDYEFSQPIHPAYMLGPMFDLPSIVFDESTGLYIDTYSWHAFTPDARYAVHMISGAAFDFATLMIFDPITGLWYDTHSSSSDSGTTRVEMPGGDVYVGEDYFYDAGSGCSVIGGSLSC